MKDNGRRKFDNLGVKPGNSQFNAEIPKDLHKQITSMAKRKGLTVAQYAERVFRAALASETTTAPSFLESWEKLIQKYASKKP